MATRTVYQLGADGVYVGPATAYESPLEPGLFHLPADCVCVGPPVPRAGSAAVWVDGSWSVTPDHRGETWYLKGTKAVIDFLGDPAERGYSATPPAPSLDDLRTAKIAAIVAASATRLATGAPINSALHVALDDGSRADLTAMAATATVAVSGAVPWPDSYARGWIAIENVRIPLPKPADGLALASAVGNYYAAIVQHRRDLKDAALAARDEEALSAVDVTAGWPAS